MQERKTDVTRLLQGGDPAAPELLSLVYDELHAIARGRMSGERVGHTLQATALVNEAYLRLVGSSEMEWRDRGHFYSAAAEAMRRILVDHARKVRSLKRGGDHQRVTLGTPNAAIELETDEFLALNDALEKLAREDRRAADVTRLRFFSGLSVGEIAEALEISERSVHREWTFARARLFEILGEN